jgi:hypothetical protein
MGPHGKPSPGGADPLSPPPGYVDAHWLGQRGPADRRARERYAGRLTARLTAFLRQRVATRHAGVRLLDIGAGTGAGARWLRSRLPFRQDWRLVDHDPAILAAGAGDARGWARCVVAAVDDLPKLLAEEPADVLTCQALLDILTADEVDTVVAAAADAGAAVLFALSVTGQVALTPGHPDDDLVARAFDAHQQRDGRLGPSAGDYAADRLRRAGYAVTVASTPWELDAREPGLCLAWLRGRAAAAAEQAPELAARFERWRRTREEQAARGHLRATVGHVDVLGLPRGGDGTG